MSGAPEATAHDSYADACIADILRSVRTVAVVGASANAVRPSYFVTQYLVSKGYEVWPVNPGRAGGKIAGLPAYATLADCPAVPDLVDVFRRPEALPGIVDGIEALPALPKVVWLQLGIRDDAVAARLEGQGVAVVQNRCTKIEYARLSGEIGWTGYNRGTISSRRPRLAKGFQHYGLD